MALVFKIRFQDTIRRWVVCEFWDQMSVVIGIQELEVKIRELFHITSTAPIIITYVDIENDVVTLADDQDMLDACLVQRLNPLRVNVKLREESPEVCIRPSISPLEPVKDGNAEAFLKACFPQSTLDTVKQFLSRYPQVVDMKLPAAELMRNVQLLKNLSGKEALAACDGSQATCTPSENEFWHPCDSKTALGSRWKSSVRKVSSNRIFHRGVQCDGCGMIPIEGPRFKSMKMYDYDLCSACFEAIGNDTDFQRMDLPVYPVSHGFYHPSCPARWSRQHIGPSAFRPSFARGPYGWMPEYPGSVQRSRNCPSSETGSKLDAIYVKDVTIIDGTKVAPCTKFTKIWQLKNSGTIPWPQKTQLVRIGGDLLSSEEVVNLELPEGGLPCGAHVDASVDLIAPEEMGQYVSHWRLMSPAGRKFGHSVWVVIQVVHQDVESAQLQEPLRGEETSDEEEETPSLETENTKNGQMSESGKGKEILISAPSLIQSLETEKTKNGQISESGKGKEILIFAPSTDLIQSLETKNGQVSESGKGKEILISAPRMDLMASPKKQPITSDRDGGKEKLASDTLKVEGISILENVADEFNGTSVEQDKGKNNSAKEPHVPVDVEVLIPQEKEQHDDGSSAIENEVDGFSVVGKPTETVGWYNITQQGSSECTQTVLLQEQSAENVVMESIKTEQEMQLQLLESMGFLDLSLSADLLEKNNQDLLLTLDDLVEVARWDNMLKDLQEMGFNDKIMNCRLLLENKGSMKRAVKDLVGLEKKKASWQEVLEI